MYILWVQEENWTALGVATSLLQQVYLEENKKKCRKAYIKIMRTNKIQINIHYKTFKKNYVSWSGSKAALIQIQNLYKAMTARNVKRHLEDTLKRRNLKTIKAWCMRHPRLMMDCWFKEKYLRSLRFWVFFFIVHWKGRAGSQRVSGLACCPRVVWMVDNLSP